MNGSAIRRVAASLIAVVAAATAITAVEPEPVAAAGDSCVGVRFVAVRGSGEGGGVAGNAATDLYNAMKDFVPAGVRTALSGVDYAAVGIPNWWDKINLVRYQSSKSGGVRNLDRYVDARDACPDERLVLIGYSQGAHVISDALSRSDGTFDGDQRAKVAAVVLIADPRFNSQESYDAGTYRKGRNGVLGARSPGDLGAVAGRIKSWCDDKDPACQGVVGSEGSVHDGGRYVREHKDAMVAFLRSKLSWYPPGGGGTYTGDVDVAFVIDTTGSMGDDIDRVKAASISLFQSMRSTGAKVRVGLIDYGDPEFDPYQARVDLQFTSDPTAFANAVNSLSIGYGGDTPEYALSGMQTAIDGLSWRNGAKKIIVPLADAPGKDPEPIGGLTSASVLQSAFELDPAQIYPVVLPGSAAPFFQALADGSSGELFEVTDPTTVVDVMDDALLTAVSSPVAVLSPVDPVQPGQRVSFSASASFDPDPSQRLTSFGWDFDADGTVDETTATPSVTHVYSKPYDGMAAVTVTNTDGVSATASAKVLVTQDDTVAPEAPPGSVSKLKARASAARTVTVTWAKPAGRVDGYVITLSAANSRVKHTLSATENRRMTFRRVTLGNHIVGVRAGNSLGLGPRSIAHVSVGRHSRRAAIEATAVRRRGAIRVDVDPNLRGRGYWRVVLQKRSQHAWQNVGKVKRTLGKKEVRVFNPPKGRYRVVVKSGHQLRGAVSAVVRVRR